MHPIITLTGGDSAPPGAKTFSIYFIEHMDSFHVYVGQSCDPARRWSQHRGKLDRGIHYNPHLQAAWAKYGPDAFSFTVIESFGSIAEMNEAERFWESYLQFLGLKLYNLQPCGNGWLKGPETRRKIGDNSVRWWQDPTYRGKQVKAHTGKVQPREAVAKMVAAQSGRPRTAAEIANLAAFNNRVRLFGKPPEQIEKHRRAMAGRKASPETCASLSKAQQMRWDRTSPETRHAHGTKIWQTRRRNAEREKQER
jgi:hypothetical protein